MSWAVCLLAGQEYLGGFSDEEVRGMLKGGLPLPLELSDREQYIADVSNGRKVPQRATQLILNLLQSNPDLRMSVKEVRFHAAI